MAFVSPLSFAEIAYPPFGYILTIESAPSDAGLGDITHFTRYGFNDFLSSARPVPRTV